MKQDINRYEVLEKITPLIENTAMRYGYIPIEIEFIKENHRWFLRIYLYILFSSPLITYIVIF